VNTATGRGIELLRGAHRRLGDRLLLGRGRRLAAVAAAVERARLGRRDDAGHDLHGLDRMQAHARFSRQHHRVGAVEDRVRHVRGLGPRRARVVDHGLEHLGRDDHRLAHAARQQDGLLLDRGHALERHLHAEVAARDHERVGHLEDLAQAGHGLGLLELDDDRQLGAACGHELARLDHVLGPAHERQRDQVDPQRQPELEVGLVLVRERRRRDVGARQVDALVVAHGSALDHARGHAHAVGLEHLEADVAVVDQERVARLDVACEVRIGRRGQAGIAVLGLAGPGRDGEGRALGEVGLAARELAEPDLRALEVEQDADRASALVGDLADDLVHLPVVVVGAVGEVQAGHVHAGANQLLDLLARRRGGPQRADDLRASVHGPAA
jgi:hypothetical protein